MPPKGRIYGYRCLCARERALHVQQRAVPVKGGQVRERAHNDCRRDGISLATDNSAQAFGDDVTPPQDVHVASGYSD